MTNIIGIDLGTTNCCVAVFKDNNLNVIADEDGKGYNTIPSYVTFLEDEILVGVYSKEEEGVYIGNTVYDSKRLIGRPFSDPQIHANKKLWPFKIINKSGKPYISIKINNETKDYAPEQISGIILSYLKELAEDFLGEPVTDAVITVPAYFNDSQRQATKDAGRLAGLNVRRIINEPTSAAIAYGFGKNYNTKKNVLIFDLGGGTFDVSILSIQNSAFEVKATSGDPTLGGRDFDNRLTSYILREFKRKHGNEYKGDINKDQKAIQRVKSKAEEVKKKLSYNKKYRFTIDSLFKGIDFSMEVTRSRFEELNMELFDKLIDPIEKAINDSGLSKDKIDEIIMVGGSSKIPKVQSILKEYFNGKEINTNGINPDEAVAIGAAIFASNLSDNESNDKIQDIVLYDVLSLSLGLETSGNSMTPLIPRNTHIPVKKTRTFTTCVDNQESVLIQVYEGEHEFTRYNHFLAKFILDNIQPAPRCVPQIDVTFDIDSNGILNVSATEKSTGKSSSITVVSSKDRLSEVQINKMIEEAERDRPKEKKEKERISFIINLKNYIKDLRNTLKNKTISVSDIDKLNTLMDSTMQWIESNPKATKEDIKNKRDSIERIALPILNKK
ncbi:heat shock protein 70 [Neocallimastix sp. 'constans']|jgi:L1 cell adhesion molecule like protein